MQTGPAMFRFDPPPPFTKKILIILLGLYIVELIAEFWLHLPLRELLAWHPQETIRKPWQMITHFLYQGSSPVSTLLEFLAIYFFLPPMQRNFGRKGIYQLAAYVLMVTAVFGSICVFIGAVGTPYAAMGIGPMVTAMVVVFGLVHPNATILLFFFPVQASWIAWGTGIFAGLGFLSSRSLSSALWLGGWIAGYLFIESQPGGKIRRYFIRQKHKKTNQKLERFTVYEGGKSDRIH